MDSLASMTSEVGPFGRGTPRRYVAVTRECRAGLSMPTAIAGAAAVASRSPMAALCRHALTDI